MRWPDMEVRNPGRKRRRSADAALEHRSPGGPGGNAASAARPAHGTCAEDTAGNAGRLAGGSRGGADEIRPAEGGGRGREGASNTESELALDSLVFDVP